MSERQNSELALSAVQAEIYPAPAPPPEPAAPPASPVATVLRTLRGRWGWALALSAVFATAGGVVAFKSAKPVYRSVGQFEILPKVASKLYETEEGGQIAMYDPFVETQVQHCRSRRVIASAMASPEWQAFGRGNSDLAIAQFEESLTVSHRPYTQLVDVSFTDLDPEVATTGANQVMKAYVEVVKDFDREQSRQKMASLEEERDRASQRLQELRQQEFELTDNLGAQAFEAAYTHEIANANHLETQLEQLELEIAMIKAVKDLPPSTVRVMTIEEIALANPVIHGLLRQQQAAKRAELELGARGLGPNHEDVVRAKHDAELATRQLDDLVKAYRDSMAGGSASREAELREKEAKRDSLAAAHAAATETIRKYSRQGLLLDHIRSDRTNLEDTLNLAKQKIERLSVEDVGAGIADRVRIVSYGERPIRAETDKRKQLLAIGVGGGVALGFGVVLLWGLRQAKMRHVADVDGEASRGRFLGVVPEMPTDPSSDAAIAAIAMGDYCVHHIRTMLQLRSTDTKRIVALTSPSPGAGKTTLSFALGMSFGAAGSRTLVVDLDFVGHGLTTAMRSLVCDRVTRQLAAAARGESDPERSGRGRHRNVMATLLAARRTAYSDAHVQELIEAARARVRAGDLGAARAAATLAAVSGSPADGHDRGARGVLGALAGVPVEECVLDTEVPNLSVLPVGDAGENDAKCLSRAAVDRLLEACRERYDTIVIDTGPVLGSMEAAFVCAAADDVVVVVARGERRPIVDEALARVSRIGADVAGVVFNRASSADVSRTSYASRSASVAAEVA